MLRLVNIFLSYFSFHQVDYKNKESKAAYLLYFNLIIVISNASIRNNIATFITYIYSYFILVKKTLYNTIGIISSKTKLFAIKCSIN